MDYFLMGLAVCVIIALICWYVSYNNRRKNHKKIKNSRSLQPVKCPHIP